MEGLLASLGGRLGSSRLWPLPVEVSLASGLGVANPSAVCCAVTWAPGEQRPLRGSPCLLGPLEAPRSPGQGRGGRVVLSGPQTDRQTQRRGLQPTSGLGEEHVRLRTLEELELPADLGRDRRRACPAETPFAETRCPDAAPRDALGGRPERPRAQAPRGPACLLLRSWAEQTLEACGALCLRLGRARFGALLGFALRTSFSEHHPWQLEQDILGLSCPLGDTTEHTGNSGTGRFSRREEMLALNCYERPRAKRRAAKLATVCRALDLFSTCVGLVPCPPGRSSYHGEKPGALLDSLSSRARVQT